MYLAAQKTLDDNEAIWIGIPAIANAKSLLNANVASIGNYSVKLENDGTGQTLEKNRSRENLENAILKVVGGMTGYTTSENLFALRRQLNYQHWQLRHAKDNELCDIASAVYQAAYPYKENLVLFLVTDEDFVALDTLRLAFPATIPAKRVVSGANSAAREAMKKLFTDTDTLLKDTLDNLIVIYRVPQPDFYNQYMAARTIVDLGHGKKSDAPPVEMTHA